MISDFDRLRHILEAIERIEQYAIRGEEAFRENELIQNWMLRHLQIIGEAARALSTSFRDSHPEISWSGIIGMRHILVHDYFGIDLDIVWQAVNDRLPDLKRKISAILAETGN
ncbi:MAG: DUF86 domain-containing protein [Candidatus Coatesbacteria bacterium]|nr:DUF86 domain-containing protein [Candidatus Coatesbacteria bacterium]